MFSVRFTEEGKRTLHKLHIETQNKIKKALKALAKDRGLGKALVGSLSGFYSLIVGKYRAIYSIKEDTIFVHYAGHRRDAYKEFEKRS